jgi:hypothetical protein
MLTNIYTFHCGIPTRAKSRRQIPKAGFVSCPCGISSLHYFALHISMRPNTMRYLLTITIAAIALTGCGSPKKPTLTKQEISQLSPDSKTVREWRLK